MGADACPGVLDTHAAADGPLARVRLPGGLLSASALVALGALALRCADGALELTSRANVQLRGVRDPAGLADGLHAAGLLPSGAHDRARNLGLSPLTGLDGALDARPVLRALDAALLADPALAELPGRFVLGVDDGSGLPGTADVALRASGAGWRLLIDRSDCGAGDITAVLEAARAFLRLRGGDATVWRVRDLRGGPVGTAGLAAALDRVPGERMPAIRERLPLGPRSSRVLVAAAWLQRLTAEQVAALGDALAPGEDVRLAPAGRLVVPLRSPGAVEALAGAGLVVAAGDARGQVTACSGLGACARAEVDVRALAEELVRRSAGRAASPAPQHLVACGRQCGLPADAEAVVCS